MHKEKITIKWHPAFCSAAEFDLRKYKDDLEFYPEYQLSKEPLQMDLLIIEKVNNKPIDNDIARIFRKYNVIEYKSPDDGLNIDDFFKTIGYAALYKGTAESVNRYQSDEITVSLFREKEPVKLFSMLKEIGMEVGPMADGIYYVLGNTLFPVQIVVTEKISSQEHSALKILSKNVDPNDIKIFLADTEKANDEHNNVDSILQASISANELAYETIRRENPMCEALRRLMKDEIDAEVNAKVNAAINAAVNTAVSAAVSAAVNDNDVKNKVEFAELMIKDGESVTKIQRYTKLTLEKLQELSDKLGVALVM